jgi:predicted AAA+ superfamily ATPase
MGKNEKIFKFLFMDVGLVSSLLNLDNIEIQKIYFNPPTDPILLHKGMISEQFVGQQLIHRSDIEKPNLFYWLRDQSTQKAEVDFVIESGLSIIPIEVKGGKTGTIKSLIQFVKDHKSKLAIKLTTKSSSVLIKEVDQIKVTFVELPLYFAERVHELSTEK